EISVVFLGGVNYYNGQVLDMERITKKAQQYGIMVGYDLAHAVGNIELKLHDWGVDFATWCSYKYLNAGPGGISGIYVHERYFTNHKMRRMAGWWGHDEKTRFSMPTKYVPSYGAEAWQQSNIPIFQAAALKASLDLFTAAKMPQLRAKSLQLTGYLIYLLQSIPQKAFTILTPLEDLQRGAQLSLFFEKGGKEVFEQLGKQGVVVDWREPNVIRLAPAPMYNNYEDVFRFYEILLRILSQE
ncbi:MAG TPA: kynureninase, partial [Cytophagales bacterium]|nr:kynureninase [Cytophagales bacterium]